MGILSNIMLQKERGNFEANGSGSFTLFGKSLLLLLFLLLLSIL